MVKKLATVAAMIVVVAIIGAVFVLVRFDLPRDEMVRKYANDASSFITLPDGSVAHYRDQGNPRGKPLLLVHGSNASLHTWEPWVQELGDAFRLISLDLPGHGLTGPTPNGDYSRDAMVEFVRDLTAALEIDRFSIAGNSMGGGVALAFALDYPLKVEQLVLVSSAGLSRGEGGEAPLVFRLAATPVVRDVMTVATPRFLIANGLYDAIVDDALVTDAMIDRYHELLLLEGNREATMTRFAQGGSRTPLDDRLGELETPALVLWGDQDSLIPVATAHRLKELMPNAKLVIYEDVGHVAMEEVPGRSAAEVRAFLSGL